MTRKAKPFSNVKSQDHVSIERYDGQYRLRWWIAKLHGAGYEKGACLGQDASTDKEMECANIAAGNHKHSVLDDGSYVFASITVAEAALADAEAAMATFQELKAVPKPRPTTVKLDIDVYWVDGKPSCQASGACCRFLLDQFGIMCSYSNCRLKQHCKTDRIAPHKNCPIHGADGALSEK